jgi:uncharacterized protein YeaC (DUF1315 family)
MAIRTGEKKMVQGVERSVYQRENGTHFVMVNKKRHNVSVQNKAITVRQAISVIQHVYPTFSKEKSRNMIQSYMDSFGIIKNLSTFKKHLTSLALRDGLRNKKVNSPKRCPNGKILNPSSGRCVNVSGKIGREILGKSPMMRKSPKRCPNGKILNPSSGRCVNVSGKIGREILGKSPLSRKSPMRKILNP